MTEQEWLTSTDPAAMYAFANNKVSERHKRYFVEACRRKFESVISIKEWDEANGLHLGAVFAMWIGWSKETTVSKPYRADLLREIIGNPIRRYAWWEANWGHIAKDWDVAYPGMLHLDRTWLTWKDGTIPNLVREITEEPCDKCGEHYCVTCDFTGFVPRTELDPIVMAVLADALEEASCTEAAILDHLRGTEPCPWCEGEGKIWGDPRTGVFEAATSHNCKHCNGTGKRPVKHVQGCWVLELLRGID